MRGFYAFTKKELLEQFRNYKLMIMLAVFFLFGMMSPVTAKLLPKMMSGMNMGGLALQIPEPTAIDAYTQFFKNCTQMGMIVVLLIFGGMLSNELTKGTLVNILAKGLPRHTVILSKYLSAIFLWTVGYLVAAITNYGYTVYLFKQTSSEHLFFSIFCLWLFGCFVLALILLSGAIVPGSFGGLILSAGTLAIMLIIAIAPETKRYNPITLASVNVGLISGTQEVGELMVTVLITILLIIGCITGSVVFFSRRKL